MRISSKIQEEMADRRAFGGLLESGLGNLCFESKGSMLAQSISRDMDAPSVEDHAGLALARMEGMDDQGAMEG